MTAFLDWGVVLFRVETIRRSNIAMFGRRLETGRADARFGASQPAHQHPHINNCPGGNQVDLLEYQGKQFFASYGIPVSAGEACEDVDTAVAVANRVGYPASSWPPMRKKLASTPATSSASTSRATS